MIKKKKKTLCFSLFLALSMFLGQLVPVTADESVPQEDTPVEVTETDPAEPGPDDAGDVPIDVVQPDDGEPVIDEEPVEGDAAGSGMDTEPVEDADEAMPDDVADDSDASIDKAAEKYVVTAYVYVAAMDEKGNRYSEEMCTLLGIDYKSINDHGWFGAGTVTLDLTGIVTPGSNLSGKNFLNNDGEWNQVLNQITDANPIDTSTVFNKTNQANTVRTYLKQAIRGMAENSNVIQNQSKLILANGLVGNNVPGTTNNDGIRYQNNSSYDINGQNRGNKQEYTWHLDLQFDTVHINYFYGNNGITDDYCKDLTSAAESKVFIKGSVMDDRPTINAPAGYKIVGYYADPDFKTEWNAFNQPINEDTNVYIKIELLNNVVINYKVQQGKGTVTDPSKDGEAGQTGMDSFNPKTGSPQGSTATPDENYEFVGWYSDADFKKLVSKEAYYTPRAPEGGWTEDYKVTYYAKFVLATKTITVHNEVTGNMGDKTHPFQYELVFYKDANHQTKVTDQVMDTTGTNIRFENGTYKFTLTHDQSTPAMQVPSNLYYVVTQTDGKEDYETSATNNRIGETYISAQQSHSHDLKEDTTVNFKNEKTATVPSGLNDHDQYLSSFMLAAGSTIILLAMIIGVRRRMSAY